MKEKKKRKLRIKGLILIILIIYLLISIFALIFKMPIKKIEITGNNYLKDNYLINYLGIDNESIFKVSKNKIKKKLLSIDLISDVTIKKDYLGSLKIKIKEDKILFYNLNKDKIILSNNREIAYNENYLGIPTLINYVPNNIYEELVKKMDKVDTKIISLISEIEYNPSRVSDKIIDENRFLFRMNDGNQVFINTVNMDKINSYLEVYEVIVNKNGNVTGCLYLDSNSENKYFNNCKEEKVSVVGDNNE